MRVISNTEAVTRAINRRGFLLDQDHCRYWISQVEQAKFGIETEMAITTGLVKPNAPIALREWFGGQGLILPDMQAATIEDALLSCQDPVLRRMLEFRLYVSKSPTTKFQAGLRRVSPDGRLRDASIYCGATKTGRWSSVGWQNLPRPIYKNDLQPEGTAARVMQDASNAIRGMIIAPPGRKLAVSDLANIEARVLAWLAGEEGELAAFAAGKDIYKRAYAGMTGKPVDAVTGDERFIGKVASLALGYGGGLGAFTQMAAGYNLDLDSLHDVVWPVTPGDRRGKAHWMLDYHKEKKSDKDLPDDTILACEAIKLGWREAHPHVVRFWKALEDGWIHAINRPGHRVEIGKVSMVYGKTGCGPALVMELPSGRRVYHHQARYSDSGLSYMSQDSMTRQWRRTGTYSGSIAETACQAVARDVLAANMPLAEMMGYDIVLSIHDEVITETDTGTIEELNDILSVVPAWAEGLPLAADGYETTERYRK